MTVTEPSDWSGATKRTGVARAPLRQGEKLQEKIEAQLRAIKLMPQLMRSFFKPNLSTFFLCLLKNVFGVGIGQRMILAKTCSWVGQYIGEVYDRCEISENTGHRCE